MRPICFSLLVLALMTAGCVKSESEEKKSSEPNNAMPKRMGIIVGDPEERVVGGGGQKPPQGGNQPQPKFNDRRVAGSQGYIGVTTDEVLDYKTESRKNPKLKLLDRPQGTEFFSNKYFGAVGGLSQKIFNQSMQQHRALNGKYPTYKEYVSMSQQQRVQLVKLPPWQKYYYDDTTGKLLVMEDPDVKARIEKQGP